MYDYLIPVTRITSSENASLETAISELLKGPVDTDNMTIDIPPDTNCWGFKWMKDHHINFSKEFNSISSSDHSEEMVLKAIKLVAMQYPEVEDVEILVEGKTYAGAARLDNIPVFANEW